MIGSSDGKQYESPLDVELGNHIVPDKEGEGASRKPAGASKSSGGTKVTQMRGDKDWEQGNWNSTWEESESYSDPKDREKKINTLPKNREYFDSPHPEDKNRGLLFYRTKKADPLIGGLHIDRSKDVPLAASALHKDGQMYGVAIDKDAPIRPEYDQYIHKHEHDEFHYMKDLITNGMDPKEAYRKAHDHITPMESARVQADLGEKGLEDYKQYWRDVSKVSGEKENPDRHPDAHTTTFGLDESELGKKYAVFRGVKGAAQTMTDASPEPINPMTPSYIQPHPGGRTGPMPWYRGAEGKWRQEIPDNKAKLTLDKAAEAAKSGKPVNTLKDILDHPELFKSYPDMKDTKVFSDPKMGLNTAYYDRNVDKIVVGPQRSEEALRSTLLHEIQHAIQHREDFSFGTSPEAMIKPVAEAMRKKGIFAFEHDPGTLRNTVLDAYQHVGGEVESRNVERRKDWPDEALRIFKPEFTQDYPYDKQLNPPK